MTAWTSDELTRIGTADELRIASLRRDGTLNRPRIIWVVRHGDELYVRAVGGPPSAWYGGTQVRHEGHIQAGGLDRDVSFHHVAAEVDAEIGDDLDAGYRSKYRRYSDASVRAVTSPEARSATIRLAPR